MRTLRSPRASRTSATRLQSNLVAGCGALHPTVSPHANSSFAARLANFRNQVAKQPGCRLRSLTPDGEPACELFVRRAPRELPQPGCKATWLQVAEPYTRR